MVKVCFRGGWGISFAGDLPALQELVASNVGALMYAVASWIVSVVGRRVTSSVSRRHGVSGIPSDGVQGSSWIATHGFAQLPGDCDSVVFASIQGR